MPLRKNLKKVLVIGSGPIVIGQAAEFDYAGTQACIALKEEGIEVVLINNNPATIMTDETVADKVYMEPLTINTIEKIIKKEKPDGIIGTLGGQTGLNLAVDLYEQNILEKYNVELLGTSVESIKNGEDRERFRNLMLKIDEPIPDSSIIHSYEEGVQYQMLRDASIKVIRELKIIGGCNIQFALNPYSNEYCIIEVNPRVSRSSALASKATGYPIARMAAKCSIGYHLDEIVNPITG